MNIVLGEKVVQHQHQLQRIVCNNAIQELEYITPHQTKVSYMSTSRYIYACAHVVCMMFIYPIIQYTIIYINYNSIVEKMLMYILIMQLLK